MKQNSKDVRKENGKRNDLFEQFVFTFTKQNANFVETPTAYIGVVFK